MGGKWSAKVVLAAAIATALGNTGAGELVVSSRLPLRTSGSEIVDNVGVPVKLACVNWYHLHMEKFVVGGLHKQPLANITSRIKELGFNCIRLPFSLEVLFDNPVIPADALAADPGFAGLRAMEFLDIAIDLWRTEDLLVVLNNHNSEAGWCCDVTSEEGLWSTSRYSTQDWIQGLGNITARYAAFSNVVAFDLRNEIHDVGDKIVTWGKTDDDTTDWKVASELAGARVLQEDSDMLIVVSGLCFGYELRPLQEDPPSLPVDDRLVFTTHMYGFSTWWRTISDILGLSWLQIRTLAIVTLTGSLLCVLFAVAPRENRVAVRSIGRREIVWTTFGWALGLCFLFTIAGVVWIVALKQGGCLAVAAPAYTTIGICVSAATLLIAGALVHTWRSRKKRTDGGKVSAKLAEEDAALGMTAEERRVKLGPVTCCRCCVPGCGVLNALVAGFVVCAFAIPATLLGSVADTYTLLDFDLSVKWRFEDTRVPIWVGEFGGNDANDPWWINFVRFLRESDLDWAYWALDGEKWWEPDNVYEDETFGILQRDFFSIRHPEMLEDLQTIQNP